ncbi:P-loop containing nucleoside triphosphate hydrolase protein [Syncephalis plumigaleata]|nr:P-loop containing nucleoside triphosphate hydrolase protein [Syncephalis plumigaleata]
MLGSPYGHDFIFKYIIIGDMGTGKSCLLKRFTEKRFDDKVRYTVGVEFGTQIIAIDDRRIKLQIWDTAGQERFRSVTKGYYRGAAGAILVYDITHVTSPNTVFCLVGNKSDMESHRQVTVQEAQRFAQQHGLLYVETSARTGINVDECFLSVASRIYELVLCGTIDTKALNSGVQHRSSSIDVRSSRTSLGIDGHDNGVTSSRSYCC